MTTSKAITKDHLRSLEEKASLALAEFFLSSLREDAGDVQNWCSQTEESVDDLVTYIERRFGLTI